MPGWFYVESGGAIGPLSRIELEAAVRSGRITPDTLVCEDGESEWRLARKVPGLITPKAIKAWQASVAAAARQPAPPPPKPPASVAPAPLAAPSSQAVDEPHRRAYVSPTASAAVPVPGTSALRKHALIAGLVALAAVGGGVLGAVLVLRVVARRQPVLPEPATIAAPARPAAPAASDGGKLRPELPSAPPQLPSPAQAIVDARLGSLRDAIAAYDEASAAFLSQGGLDASTLATREALAARSQALEDLRTQNESLRRALSALPDQVKEAATQAGLEPEVADAASRRAKADVAAQARERERDAEMQDLAGEALGVLEQSFGSWTVKDHAVAFGEGADPDVAERYARVVEDSAALAARR